MRRKGMPLATRVATRSADEAAAEHGYALISAVCSLAHPRKEDTGGEDAFLLGPQMVGVADAHPFLLSTSDTGPGRRYATGVRGTHPAARYEFFVFTPGFDAPTRLWYQSASRSGVGARRSSATSEARRSSPPSESLSAAHAPSSWPVPRGVSATRRSSWSTCSCARGERTEVAAAMHVIAPAAAIERIVLK